MRSYEQATNKMMTWIDVTDDDETKSVSRTDYQELVDIIKSTDESTEAFVITKPALESLLRAIAVALIHSGH